jgi:AcrR family transcriptional regulator
MKTRDKIILTSLALYNVRGLATVSNNHVSEEMEISPGNLHYHFKTKQQVVDAIFCEFEKEFSELFVVDMDTISTIEDLFFILHLSYELMEYYCFMFRDIDYIITKYPDFKRRLQRIFAQFSDANMRLCSRLVEAGVMEISATQLNGLATNLLLIFTQWLSFRPFSGNDEMNDETYLSKGVYQAVLLLEPYLNDESKGYLNDLGNAYRKVA